MGYPATFPEQHVMCRGQESKQEACPRSITIAVVVCLGVPCVLGLLGQAALGCFLKLITIDVSLGKAEALWENYLPVPLQIVTCALAITCFVNSMWKFVEEVRCQMLKCQAPAKT